MWNWLRNKFFIQKKERLFYKAIYSIIGFTPSNIDFYLLACTHKSILKIPQHTQQSNERLEYLGDALLGAVVADYLFTEYPEHTEGDLSKYRSRIVNREALTLLAKKIDIQSVLRYDKKNFSARQVVLGNAVEAIIGAIYLDRGYYQCKKFIIHRLIVPYLETEKLFHSDNNYKSKIINWAQRTNTPIRFDVKINSDDKKFRFVAKVLLTEKIYGTGYGHSKKKAEQEAAKKTCVLLDIPGL